VLVSAARNAVQAKMDNGVGIEEQTKIAAQRGMKVVGIVQEILCGGPHKISVASGVMWRRDAVLAREAHVHGSRRHIIPIKASERKKD